MKRTIAMRLAASLLCALAGAATAVENPLRFDNWVYYTKNFDGSAQWEYDPRLLAPFSLGNGWTFTQRIDIPFPTRPEQRTAGCVELPTLRCICRRNL
jgi:hypothetical protein